MARRPLAQAIGFELSCFALSPVTRERSPRIDGHRSQRAAELSSAAALPRGRTGPRAWRVSAGAFALMALRFLPGFAPPVVSAAAHPAPSPKAAHPSRPGLEKFRQVRPSRSPNRVVGACITSTINRVIQVLYSPNERLLIYGAVRSLTFY